MIYLLRITLFSWEIVNITTVHQQQRWMTETLSWMKENKHKITLTEWSHFCKVNLIAGFKAVFNLWLCIKLYANNLWRFSYNIILHSIFTLKTCKFEDYWFQNFKIKNPLTSPNQLKKRDTNFQKEFKTFFKGNYSWENTGLRNLTNTSVVKVS